MGSSKKKEKENTSEIKMLKLQTQDFFFASKLLRC